MEKKIEATMAKFLEFKLFELFRTRLIEEIKPHCREDSKVDIYKHLFLCPSPDSKRRNFQLRGVLSPFVCMWRTSPIIWNTDNGLYARSVLPRNFEYLDIQGNKLHERGYLYDIKFTIELFSSSYYKDFRDRVNQDLLDMDRLRYFFIDVKELLKDCASYETSAEVFLRDIRTTDSVSTEQNRSFDLSALYEVRITVPYSHSFAYLSGIELYLNDNLIFQRDVDYSGE